MPVIAKSIEAIISSRKWINEPMEFFKVLTGTEAILGVSNKSFSPSHSISGVNVDRMTRRERLTI